MSRFIWGLLALVFWCAGLGCGVEEYPPTPEGLYMANCSRCHELDGSSATASDLAKAPIDLRADAFQRNVSDFEILQIMETGVGQMQGIQGLESAQRDSILLHVRRLAANP